jgi:uncharacterized membrane protein YdbT with pleckstrin-like domain
MYEALKEWLLWVMRVPPEPLDPMGDVESLRVFRPAPGYLRYRIAFWAIAQMSALATALVVLIPLLIGSLHSGPVGLLVAGFELLVVLLYPIQALFSFFLLRLNYEMRWYKVADRSLRIREGVWAVHEMTMTFANIQNINLTQGPLQRLFGIADVRVETAGGGGMVVPQQHGELGGSSMHVGVFRGVDNAEEIRDLMLYRLRLLRDTGLGDIDEAVETPAGAVAAMPALVVAGWSEQGLALLAALRREAAALRQAAETAAGRG